MQIWINPKGVELLMLGFLSMVGMSGLPDTREALPMAIGIRKLRHL
ncbi:hypothetical protein C943_01459 [Mariniradius saccharolyticus AK6]|uniref:Uncharacterized protein n=1 Tax=Mariniradius saccharolyticus AK6 TaxID=1239962 RepID=M7XUM5_9BACT|nr:hypothetical protein C943_01459 [Mariniradius saccharolyticus AK6]